MRKVLTIALVVISMVSVWAQEDRDFFIIARNTGEKVMANGDTIRVFGFAESLNDQPSVPGPTLYMNEGDSVHIDLWNVSQGAPHTIHLHGLDVDQQNDGVPHLSFEIAHMDHGYYHFKAPHAGTYLYHCHVASTVHVQAGMYGLIVVRPSDGTDATWNGGYAYDREFSFMTSEIDTLWHQDSVLNHPHGHGADPIYIPHYDPQFYLINGESDDKLVDHKVRVRCLTNKNTYLRFANIGFYANQIIFPEGLNAQIVASDGRPLPSLIESDTLLIFPGERYGVLINPDQEMNEQITFNYLDLNAMQLKGEQRIQALAQDLISIEERFTQFMLYPNPSNGQITIQWPNALEEDLWIQIVDMQGKVVHRQITFKAENSAQIQTQLMDGLYVVQLVQNGEIVGQRKVLQLSK